MKKKETLDEKENLDWERHNQKQKEAVENSIRTFIFHVNVSVPYYLLYKDGMEHINQINLLACFSLVSKLFYFYNYINQS